MQKEIRKTISKIKETGLQLLFPGRCPVCDGIVRPFGRKICPECLPKLKLASRLITALAAAAWVG